jgi:AcrR family transcriptional regulator
VELQRAVGQHHGDLRRALLDAALDMVGEGELPALTLRAVARRAGVSVGAPYHHFADKGALLAEVAREGFVALGEVQAATAEAEPDSQRRLVRMGAAYVRFALAHHTHYTVMFLTPPGAVGGAVGGALQAAAMATFEALVAAIGGANPSLPPGLARQRALLAWGQAHGAVEVARWAHHLSPGFDAAAFAEGVGRSCVGIACAPVG